MHDRESARWCTRDEFVATLRERYRSGGLEATAPITDAIREAGQALHEPDWLVCPECGWTTEYKAQNPGRRDWICRGDCYVGYTGRGDGVPLMKVSVNINRGSTSP